LTPADGCNRPGERPKLLRRFDMSNATTTERHESVHLIAEEAITLAAALVNAAANIAGNQTEPPSV